MKKFVIIMLLISLFSSNIFARGFSGLSDSLDDFIEHQRGLHLDFGVINFDNFANSGGLAYGGGYNWMIPGLSLLTFDTSVFRYQTKEGSFSWVQPFEIDFTGIELGMNLDIKFPITNNIAFFMDGTLGEGIYYVSYSVSGKYNWFGMPAVLVGANIGFILDGFSIMIAYKHGFSDLHLLIPKDNLYEYNKVSFSPNILMFSLGISF